MLHGLGTGGGSGGSPNPLRGLDSPGGEAAAACRDDLQNSARVEIEDVEADIRTPLSSPSLDPPAAGLGSPGVLSLSDVVMPAAALARGGSGSRTGGERRSAFPDSADGVGVEYDSDAIETESSDGGGGAAGEDDGAGGGGPRRGSKQVRFNPEMDVKMMSILSEDTAGFTSPGSSMSPARADKAGTTTLTMEAPPPRNWDVEEVAGSTRYRKTSVSRENYRQLCRSTGRRVTRTSGDYLKLHFLPGVFATAKDAAPQDGAATGETEGFVDRDDGELAGLCAALSTSSASDDDDTAYHRDDDDDTASASTVDAAEVTDESDLEGLDGDAAAHAAQRRKAAAAAAAGGGVRRTKLQKRTERRTEEYAKLGLTPRRVLRDKGYNLAYMQGHWVTLMRQPLTVIGNVVHFWSTKEAVFFDTAVGLLRPKESTLSTFARDGDVGGAAGIPKMVACSFLDERVVLSKYSQHGDGSFRWKSATPPLPAKFSQAGRALLKGNRELFLKMYHVAWSDGDEWTRELDPLCTPILVETYDDAAYVKQHFANNNLPAPSARHLKQKAVVKALHPTLPSLVELHFINQSLNGGARGRRGDGDGDGDGDNQSDAAGHPRKDAGRVQWWPTCTVEPVLPPLHRSSLQTKAAVLRGGPADEAHGRSCFENLRPWRGKVFFALLFLLSVIPVVVLVVSV